MTSSRAAASGRRSRYAARPPTAATYGLAARNLRKFRRAALVVTGSPWMKAASIDSLDPGARLQGVKHARACRLVGGCPGCGGGDAVIGGAAHSALHLRRA